MQTLSSSSSRTSSSAGRLSRFWWASAAGRWNVVPRTSHKGSRLIVVATNLLLTSISKSTSISESRSASSLSKHTPSVATCRSRAAPSAEDGELAYTVVYRFRFTQRGRFALLILHQTSRMIPWKMLTNKAMVSSCQDVKIQDTNEWGTTQENQLLE